MFEEPKDRLKLNQIYPDFSEAELMESEENLRRYLAVVRSVFESIRTEKPEILTELRRRVRIREQKAHS